MRVVLAYSGGLDTSAAIVWLKTVKKVWVHAVLVDVGQEENLADLQDRAYALGADAVSVVDRRKAMVEQGVFPLLMLGARYEQDYLLGTAIARPFIADALVEAALESGAGAICHGATGKGNDYLRFEQRIKILAPGMAIISPWREWSFEGRDEACELVRQAGVSLPAKAFDYSIDANLMHRSYEGGVLENLQQPLPEFFQEAMTRPGQVDLEIGFSGGLPCSLNGEEQEGLPLMQKLNAWVSQTAFGWLDLLETRTNGLKSRGIYHTPAGSVLHLARTALNRCWFPKPVLDALDEMGRKVGVLVYQGVWQHPLQMAYQTAARELYAETKGSISLRVCGAQALIQSRAASPNLFKQALGGFGHMSQWPSQFSEALVFFQHLQHHSQLPGIDVKELCI